MIDVLPPENSGIRPFSTDFEYLASELDWVASKVQRLVCQCQLEDMKGTQYQRGACRNVFLGKISPERVALLREEERAIRDSIDARLKLNRTVGPDVGLDRLCRDFILGDFERNLLLLSVIPCLGNKYCEQVLWRLDPVVRSNEVSVESVALFMELPFDDTVKELIRILPGAPLRKAELVETTYEPTYPADALSVGIHLTGKCLAAISGVPALAGFRATPPGEVY